MKKTGTTVLSLALALILVSTLSSGVILADDDDDDNRKKNKKKYHTVYDVAILDCDLVGMTAAFLAFDSSDAITLPGETVAVDSCAVDLAFLLSLGFEIEDVGTVGLGMAGGVSRYTTVRKRRVRND